MKGYKLVLLKINILNKLYKMLMKNIVKFANSAINFSKLSKFNFFTKNIIKQQYFINKSYFQFSTGTGNIVDEKHALEYIEAGVFEVLKGTSKIKIEKLNRAATLDDLGLFNIP